MTSVTDARPLVEDLGTAAANRADHVFPAPRFPSGIAVAPTLALAVLMAAASCLMALTAPAVDEQEKLLPDVQNHPHVLAGAFLAAAGIAAFWAIRVLVITPIRQLRDDVEAGLSGERAVARRSRTEEVDRIVRAVLEQAGQDAPARSTIRALVVVPLLGLLILGCLVGSGVTVAGSLSVTMELQVAEGQRSTEAVAAAVRHDLEAGLAGLAASGHDMDSGSAELGAALLAVLRTRPIFKAAYVVDRAGRIVEERGDGRAVFYSVPPVGLKLLNDAGAEPVVVATVPLREGSVLVAEYDVADLNDRIKRAGAPISVVDPDLRTILSSDGYLAFAPLEDQHIRDAVARASAGVPTVVAVPAAGSRMAFVRSIGFQDQSAGLGWTVVQGCDLAATAFAKDPTGRMAVVVYGTAAGLVVLLLGWTYVVTLRPLSRIAKHACLMASAGSRSDAESALIAPHHINEVGAVAAALNCRMQAAQLSGNRPAAASIDSLAVPVRPVPASNSAARTVAVRRQAPAPLTYDSYGR